MNFGNKKVVGMATAVLALALLMLAFGVRRYLNSRPPEPSPFSVEIANKMTADRFQPPGSDFSLPYRIHVPTNLEPGRKYPLVVYLHGAGDNGNDNVRHLGLAVAELIRLSQAGEPAFILAPQAPWGQNWVKVPGPPFLNFNLASLPESPAIQATRALIQTLPQRYAVDPDRLYLMGFSAGAAGCWDLLARQPTHPFAASTMLSGAYDPSLAKSLARTPLWFFHGERDEVSPYTTTLDTVKALQAQSGTPRYTLVEGVGHDTTEAAFAHGAFKWLLEQRRSTQP